jgi:hypothetical protein
MWKSDNNDLLDTMYVFEMFIKKREEAVKDRYGSKAKFIVLEAKIVPNVMQCKVKHQIVRGSKKSNTRVSRLDESIHHLFDKLWF